MAKRKRSSSPNIPQETLARARQQAGVEPESEPVEPVAPAPKPAPVPKAAASVPTASAPQSSTRTTTGSPRRRTNYAQPTPGTRSRRKSNEMSAAVIENLLEHPTKVVSEAELRAQYGFVLKDLRNMGILAAGLMLSLVVLAIFFVH